MGRPPRIGREQILDTARRIFAAQGFAATTLSDIAGRLGVTPAALLRHVGSKDALFHDAMHGSTAIEIPAILRDSKVCARASMRVVFGICAFPQPSMTAIATITRARVAPIVRYISRTKYFQKYLQSSHERPATTIRM